MAAVAAELNRAGVIVSGSDSGCYPPMSDFLREHSVPTLPGYHPGNIPPNSLIVVGNSVSRGNLELEYALNQRLSLISLPDLIANRYLCRKKSIVVTGTHGKTTTTAMLTHILQEDNRDPGWMIGGIPVDLPVPCELSSGEEFVIEGDEYDAVYWDKRPKFLLYKPSHAIINSIEFDHADIYDNLDAIELQFRRFVKLLPENGIIVANGDSPLVRSICEDAFCGILTIGTNDGYDWKINFNAFKEENKAQISCPDYGIFELDSGLPGKHNLMNGLAATAMSVALGVKIENALKALKKFRGVARRFEIVRQDSFISVYDDFAHHPTAIKTTLETIVSRHPNQKIWALLEPRSNSMVRSFFSQELIDGLKLADVIVIGKVHRADAIPSEQRLDRNMLSDELTKLGKQVCVADQIDEIEAYLRANLSGSDAIVMMSNGSFDRLRDRLISLGL